MTWESVRDAARKLTVPDRLRLVESLWDELGFESGAMELSPEFQAELDRRIQNADISPEAGRPWREVLAELKAKDHAASRPAS